MSGYFLDRAFSLASVPGVTDIRGYGMLAGVDIDPAIVGINGYELQKRLFDHGLHVKTTGNTAILSPPFIAEDKDFDFIVETIREVLASRG